VRATRSGVMTGWVSTGTPDSNFCVASISNAPYRVTDCATASHRRSLPLFPTPRYDLEPMANESVEALAMMFPSGNVQSDEWTFGLRAMRQLFTPCDCFIVKYIRVTSVRAARRKLVKLYRKPKSKFYWYDFTVRDCRHRGSTHETKSGHCNWQA
jgi:hypothetical protein